MSIRADFQVFGKVIIEERFINCDVPVTLEEIVKELNRRVHDSDLGIYGKLSPVIIRVVYEGTEHWIYPSCRCAFDFHDKLSFNKFKLRYPDKYKIVDALDSIGLNYDGGRKYLQHAGGVACVKIVNSEMTHEETKYYNYETKQLFDETKDIK